MKIFVVILNFNGKEFILQCLESVMKLETRNLETEIVVVDNGSSDDSVKLVEQRYKDRPAGKAGIKILSNKNNLGFAEGNNVGIRYALENGADYVMLLNPDTLVNKNLLVQLVKVAEGEDKIGILSPKIYFAPGFEYHHDRYKDSERGRVIWYAGGVMDWKNVLASHRGVDEVDHGQYDEVMETDFGTGCCLLMKSQVFKKIGFLDEKYFLYFEDNDFCQRARRAGFGIYYVPDAFLFHLNAGSTSSGSDLQDYYISRNRMLFGIRYVPLRAKIALLRESLKLLLSGRKWQKAGVRDFYLGKFSKGTYPKK